MTAWNTHYIPPDKIQWRGHYDTPSGSSFFQIVQTMNLFEPITVSTQQQVFGLLGFKCDEGIRRNHGRIGATEGPSAIRQALATFPVQKENFSCFDVGTIFCQDGDLETAQLALAETIEILLHEGITPIILGGGHETAWGHYQGIAKVYPQQTLGIISFDAHIDMHPMLTGDKGSAGTAFLQMAKAHKTENRPFDYNCIGVQHASNIRSLFDTAKSYNGKLILADEIHEGQLEKCFDFIDRVIDQNEMIYLSLSLDVFSAAHAPAVSSTQPLGLTPWHVIPLLRQLAASNKVISYDIVGLCPRYDIDHITAKLAANLIYEIIHHHSEQPRTW